MMPPDGEVKWVKSSESIANGQCVEVAHVPGAVVVRNSRYPEGPMLMFTPEEWDAFTGAVRKGEFDGFGKTGL